MGKHKPTYNPSDPECGDYVVVVNAGDMVYSQKTYEKKVYRWYTGWPGGLKSRTLKVSFAWNELIVVGDGRKEPREDIVASGLWHAAQEPRTIVIFLFYCLAAKGAHPETPNLHGRQPSACSASA